MNQESVSFQPSPKMKELYYTYLSIPGGLIFLFVVFPILFFFGFHIYHLAVYLPLLVFFTTFCIWISSYYASLSYNLTESHLLVQEGVLFKKRKRIPYNQITNAAIRQGPFKRSYGIANINIQTAGHSGQTGSEATLRALGSYEDIDEEISQRTKSAKTERAEAKPEQKPTTTTQEAILHELQTIKDLLKKIMKSSN